MNKYQLRKVSVSKIAKAQLEEDEEVTEDEVEAQKSSDQPAVAPNGLSLRLDRAHFIPLIPLSDSPGNQVKMLLDYTVEESSPLLDGTVNAVMEVYAANQTLLACTESTEIHSSNRKLIQTNILCTNKFILLVN